MIVFSLILGVGALSSPAPLQNITTPAIMLRMEQNPTGYSNGKETLTIKSDCGQTSSYQADCNKVHLVNDHPERGQQVNPSSAKR